MQASGLGAIERPTQSGERTFSPAEWIQKARRCSEAGPPHLPTVAGCVRLSVEVRTQNRCPPVKAGAPPPRPGCGAAGRRAATRGHSSPVAQTRDPARALPRPPPQPPLPALPGLAPIHRFDASTPDPLPCARGAREGVLSEVGSPGEIQNA